jgi:hypothetical protein
MDLALGYLDLPVDQSNLVPKLSIQRFCWNGFPIEQPAGDISMAKPFLFDRSEIVDADNP